MAKNYMWPNAQTMTFTAITTKTKTAGNFTITATTSQSLPVTYVSNTPTYCTVAGAVVTMTGTGPGTASITAYNNGNNTYDGCSATNTFSVT